MSAIEVTGKLDLLPMIMEEGKVELRGWWKGTTTGSGVVWYEASESGTQSVGATGLSCQGHGVQGERQGRHPAEPSGWATGPLVEQADGEHGRG